VVEVAGIEPVFHRDSYQLGYSLDTKLRPFARPVRFPCIFKRKELRLISRGVILTTQGMPQINPIFSPSLHSFCKVIIREIDSESIFSVFQRSEIVPMMSSLTWCYFNTNLHRFFSSLLSLTSTARYTLKKKAKLTKGININPSAARPSFLKIRRFLSPPHGGFGFVGIPSSLNLTISQDFQNTTCDLLAIHLKA